MNLEQQKVRRTAVIGKKLESQKRIEENREQQSFPNVAESRVCQANQLGMTNPAVESAGLTGDVIGIGGHLISITSFVRRLMKTLMPA